jgi:hypothetical protein
MGRKKKKDEVEMEYLPRKTQIFVGVQHKVFAEIPEHQKINELTARGTRVLVARYPDFYKIYLSKFMPVGKPSFPRGGVLVWNATYEQTQAFYLESVSIHPEGGSHKFYESDE